MSDSPIQKEMPAKKTKEERAATRKTYRTSERGQEVERRAKIKYLASEKGKKSMSDCSRRAVKKNPEKRKAVSVAAYAVKCGHLIRPENCTQCGNTGRIEGHHEDYSKPLEVIWLCTSCHSDLHKAINELQGKGS